MVHLPHLEGPLPSVRLGLAAMGTPDPVSLANPLLAEANLATSKKRLGLAVMETPDPVSLANLLLVETNLAASKKLLSLAGMETSDPVSLANLLLAEANLATSKKLLDLAVMGTTGLVNLAAPLPVDQADLANLVSLESLLVLLHHLVAEVGPAVLPSLERQLGAAQARRGGSVLIRASSSPLNIPLNELFMSMPVYC